MRTLDLIGGAARNIAHSRLRTTLAVTAVTIGSFTLTLTTGIGAGVNSYISETINAIGAPTTMEIQHSTDEDSGTLPSYDPEAGAASGGFDGTELGISEKQLDDARAIPGVIAVEPVVGVNVQYISGPHTDERFAASLTSPELDNVFQMTHGRAPDTEAGTPEVALPELYVDSLGYADRSDIIGDKATFGFRTPTGELSTIDATVTGVILPSVVPVTTAIGNSATIDRIADAQQSDTGNTAPTTAAALTFDPDASETVVADIKADLVDIDLEGTTVNDRIGIFKSVIDGIVLILSGFALIALVAASFGVANTLLMSVQERTREVGLRKALGSTGGSVFGMFAIEALLLGVLGWAIGAGLALAIAIPLNGILQSGPLQDLPGLSVYTVDPVLLALVFLVVVGISCVAGTVPAMRAANKDPIEALRYE